MTYDKKRYEEIQQMSAGDLVHTMMVNFDPDMKAKDNTEGSFLQNQDYSWAAERLNELLPMIRAALANKRYAIDSEEGMP